MSPGVRAARRDIPVWLVPVGLYVVAAVARWAAASQVPFPTTEVSAYFVGVAQNVLGGGGLVSDAVWSYATPPLEAPKAAFEIWLPMASLVSAASMAVLGASFASAQAGGALLGALVAPLVWGVAREAARVQGLDRRRGNAVAITAGLIAAFLSPYVLATIVPDSYTPFTVFVLASALLLPASLGIRDGRASEPPSRTGISSGLGLGIVMGLAYLSRQEIIWFGLTVLLMTAWVVRERPAGKRLREASTRIGPMIAGGLLVVVPWLLRNIVEFGSPMPGQAVENMFLQQNEDIFAFLERPSLDAYLSQGLGTILTNPLRAAIDGFVDVLVIPAFPIGIVGLVAAIAMWRAPALRRPTALVALLLSGAIVFATTVLLFPVASLWGTFAHASGPLMAGLIVLATLGGDALIAWVSRRRRWEKPNVVIAPIALLTIVVLLALLQLRLIGEQSRDVERHYRSLAATLLEAETEIGMPMPDTIITDHPMWLAGALGRAAIALPDEPTGSLRELSRMFDAPWVVVIDERGRYPGALLDEHERPCLAHEPWALEGGDHAGWLFILADTCDEAG